MHAHEKKIDHDLPLDAYYDMKRNATQPYTWWGDPWSICNRRAYRRGPSGHPAAGEEIGDGPDERQSGGRPEQAVESSSQRTLYVDKQ